MRNDARKSDVPTDGACSGRSLRTLQRIAPLWHTATLVIVILIFSTIGSNRQHLVTTSRARVLQYLLTLVWEWMLFAFCVWGARKSGTSLRQLVGGRWREIEDVLIDVLTAAGFWVVAMVALAFAARLLNLTGGNQLEEVRRQIGFLVPRSTLELELWILLSVTAGILRRNCLPRLSAAPVGCADRGMSGPESRCPG